MDGSTWTKTSCIEASTVITEQQPGCFPPFYLSSSLPCFSWSVLVFNLHYNENISRPWNNFLKRIFVFQPVSIKAPSRAVFLYFSLGLVFVVSRETCCHGKDPSKGWMFQTPFTLARRPEYLKGFSNFICPFCCWIACPRFTNIYHRPSLKMRWRLDFSPEASLTGNTWSCEQITLRFLFWLPFSLLLLCSFAVIQVYVDCRHHDFPRFKEAERSFSLPSQSHHLMHNEAEIKLEVISVLENTADGGCSASQIPPAMEWQFQQWT